MSSFEKLPVPKLAEETSIAGWDESVEGTWQNSDFRATVASHAIADQSFACGTAVNNNTDGDWISWSAPFGPNRVCRVVSNRDGSVVAVATDGGSVAILRGTDGKLIASRRVAPEGVRIPAELSFVGGNLETPDALVIEPPEDNYHILVSNIDGVGLNSTNPGLVSEAARNMSISQLRLHEADNCRFLVGSFRGSEQIRFAMVDGDGKLAIEDYSMSNKSSTLVEKRIEVCSSINRRENASREVDYNAGLRVQATGANRNYVVMSTFQGKDTNVCWFDMENLKVACEYGLTQYRLKRLRVEALETVSSCDKEHAMAIAFATKPHVDSSAIKIDVVQVVVDSADGSSTVGAPHLIFTIPLAQSIRSISIASISSASGPYSFLCKSWDEQNRCEYRAFVTRSQREEGRTIGTVRLLVQHKLFDKALKIVKEIGEDSLVQDPFSQFHPSEIHQRKLLHLLTHCDVGDEKVVAQSKDCLHQLASGAMSGNKFGQISLLSAAESLLQWPSDALLNANFPPKLSEMILALSGFIATITAVVDSSNVSECSQFIDKKTALQEKLAALKYLDSVLESSKQIRMTPPLGDFRSPNELFGFLVEKGYFLAAEQMWRSELRPKLTTEAMVSSILAVKPDVDPKKYSSLLKEVVFPSLTINHELLAPLLAWSCQTADAFDEIKGNGNGLDDSISLLSLVARATNGLRSRVHSSFASYSPFVGRSDSRHGRLLSPRNSTTDSTLEDSSFSFDISSYSQERKGEADSDEATMAERPNPTLLKLGHLKGGAQKLALGQLATVADDMDGNEDLVELKLTYARLLKQARDLGLKRSLVSLQTFSRCGGVQYIAKELVRTFSAFASNHEERHLALSTHCKCFCHQSGANLEEALLEYSKELCRGSKTSKQAIQEACSIARSAENANIKCQIILTALRAALFCRYSPTWLSELSTDAIQWASGDCTLRSELEESSRLLLIDGIVGRYCGEGAKELFHVDNPRHAARLLQHVSQHIHCQTVLADVLNLCDAFAHLSQVNACSLVMQYAILNGDSDVYCSVLETLYKSNRILAKKTFAKVLTFVCDVVGDSSTESDRSFTAHDATRQKQSKLAADCACEIIPIALSHLNSSAGEFNGESSCSMIDEVRLEALLQDFERIRTLQTDYSIYLSIFDLQCPKTLIDIINNMFKPIVEASLRGCEKVPGTLVTRARRVSSILAGNAEIKDSELWFAAVGSSACRIAWMSQGSRCMDFLSSLGVLEATENYVAARACIALALCLCHKASQQQGQHEVLDSMKMIVLASSLLQDYALLACPETFLGFTVAIGELADMVGQVLVKTDEGFGEALDEFRKELKNCAAQKRWPFSPTKEGLSVEIGKSLRLRRPALHTSWYVGDGLLLPPLESLSRGIDYCRSSVGASRGLSHSGDKCLQLHFFLEGRGAHSLSLRLLGNSTAIQLCLMGSSECFDSLSDANQQTSTSLAERYLGGTGNGITSGIVDSQLAVSMLLSLPAKHAFKVFRSTLPTAISTRDFRRVVCLANVGKIAGSGGRVLAERGATLGWKVQHKFVAQCTLIAKRAVWWDVLQQHHVEFDPRRFEDVAGQDITDDNCDQNARPASSYVASLVPMLICNLSKTVEDVETVLGIVTSFCVTFGLSSDLGIQRIVEFLLSPPLGSPAESSSDYQHVRQYADVRLKLPRVEAITRRLLRRLESPMKRSSVLRNCVIGLENSESDNDYERMSVVLSIYQDELNAAIVQLKGDAIDFRPFAKELELVDRRRDALAILSSYFEGDRKFDRPHFSKFFPRLTNGSDEEAHAPLVGCSVLGSETEPPVDSFDPLDPLLPILSSSHNLDATAALAPLCLALGVPSGYIHARSLIVRFKKAIAEGTSLPGFDGDVMSVVNRLKASGDRADIAEWCASRYSLNNGERLKCLEIALKYAMQASNEAEKSRSKGRVAEALDANIKETKALDRAKRIRSAYDLLTDRATVNSILCSSGDFLEKHACLNRAVDRLMLRLETDIWSKAEFVPEHFIELFLSEASLLAAESCMNGNDALSMNQFRQFSIVVHRVCRTIGDKYSHVHVGTFIRRLTRRWLFHGDHHTSAHDEHEAPNGKAFTDLGNSRGNVVDLMGAIDEEDTMNFVMDLSNLRDDDNLWSSDIGSGPSASLVDRKLTSEEEPSCFKAHGSARESSELASRRAALRIAFVMAFAEGYYSDGATPQSQDENRRPSRSRPLGPANIEGKSGRSRVLSRIGSRSLSDQNEAVMEHGRELLRIVFAKSGGSHWIDRDLSFDSRSFEDAVRPEKRKIITFAMRHRALRAASILVPQEGLEEVVKEEGYIGLGSNCSLKKCSFGVFVAKEIEEMGLPLPHSDLTQLSTMHFASYARALWRYHRDGDMKGSNGRLLLLILEMCLKEKVNDAEFIKAIFAEMERLNLPRTLLMATEALVRYKERSGMEVYSSSMHKAGDTISHVIACVSEMLFSELGRYLSNPSESGGDSFDVFSVVLRLGEVTQCFCDNNPEGQRNLVQFIQHLLTVMGGSQSGDCSEPFGTVLCAALRRVQDRSEAERLREKIEQLGIEASGSRQFQPSINPKDEADSLSGALDLLEVSLNNS